MHFSHQSHLIFTDGVGVGDNLFIAKEDDIVHRYSPAHDFRFHVHNLRMQAFNEMTLTPASYPSGLKLKQTRSQSNILIKNQNKQNLRIHLSLKIGSMISIMKIWGG